MTGQAKLDSLLSVVAVLLIGAVVGVLIGRGSRSDTERRLQVHCLGIAWQLRRAVEHPTPARGDALSELLAGDEVDLCTGQGVDPGTCSDAACRAVLGLRAAHAIEEVWR
jgi:hypothetical protein